LKFNVPMSGFDDYGDKLHDYPRVNTMEMLILQEHKLQRRIVLKTFLDFSSLISAGFPLRFFIEFNLTYVLIRTTLSLFIQYNNCLTNLQEERGTAYHFAHFTPDSDLFTRHSCS
jgi:hypothetical protein